jgi:hypothetical protein
MINEDRLAIIKNHFEVFIVTSKSREIALSSQKLGYITSLHSICCLRLFCCLLLPKMPLVFFLSALVFELQITHTFVSASRFFSFNREANDSETCFERFKSLAR